MRYGYVGGDPVNRVDPTGLVTLTDYQKTLVVAAAIGVAFVYGATMYSLGGIPPNAFSAFWQLVGQYVQELLETINDILAQANDGPASGSSSGSGSGSKDSAQDQAVEAENIDPKYDDDGKEINIALGISTALLDFSDELNERFERENKDIRVAAYPEWFKYGITSQNVTGGLSFSQFELAVSSSPTIHFNVWSEDEYIAPNGQRFSNIIEEARTREPVNASTWPEYSGITAAELRYIMDSPSVCARTKFYSWYPSSPNPLVSDQSLKQDICN